MKALITGGAGFVGRWFTAELLERGWEVDCVDNLVLGGGGRHPEEWAMFNPTKQSGFHFHNVDVRDFLADNTTKYDIVVQLAAVVGGRMTIERNPLAVAEDLSIDAMFWHWAKDSSPGHIIAFSSSAAYPVDLQGRDSTTVLRESDLDFKGHLGVPDLSYGWAKMTNEFLGRLAHERYGLSVACYRPFSGYGEDQDLNYPFPSICRRAANEVGSSVFRVWGSGRQGRDFIHISDIVSIVMTTYPKIIDGTAVNLSTGRLTTFLELGAMAVEAAGYEATVVGDETMPEGVFSRVGDPTLMEKLGGRVTVPLEEGVRRGVSYHQMMATP